MNPVLVVARRLGAERRTMTLSVTVGATLTLFLQIAVYPSIRDSLAEMSSALPEAFARLVGSDEFASPEGFLQAEAYGTMAPILVLLVAITLGSSGLAGTERSGRMALLATSSVPRRDIAIGAALSMMASVTLVAGVYWVATIVGSSVGDLDIAIGRLTAATASLWLLGLAVGAVAFALGGLTGNRSLAIGTATAVALGSYFAYGLLPLSETLAPGRYVSLWYPYADHRPLEQGFDPGNAAILLGLVAIGVVVGVRGFGSRDID